MVKILKDRGILASLLHSLFHGILLFAIAFAVGTGAGAIACWYYEVPLIFSLIGGILVLGVALALMSENTFY